MIISGAARIVGVMGWPVAHSKSPRLHNFWLERYGIDGAYVPLVVKPDDIAPALRALEALGFAGVNLTVPHKQAALAAARWWAFLARCSWVASWTSTARESCWRVGASPRASPLSAWRSRKVCGCCFPCWR